MRSQKEMIIEIQQLKYFVEIALLGNLTEASKKLNTVQSNVTAKIKQLEFELGKDLFVRSTQGMKLTPFGTELLGHAQMLLGKEKDILAFDTLVRTSRRSS